MNEVKLSTTVSENRSFLTLKIDPAAIGLNWERGSIVRVKSYKKEGRIVLKAVGKKVSKTVCHTLTSTGGNATSHSLGFKLNFRKNRFKAPLTPVQSVNAAVRFTNDKKNELEIFLPRDIYQR